MGGENTVNREKGRVIHFDEDRRVTRPRVRTCVRKVREKEGVSENQWWREVEVDQEERKDRSSIGQRQDTRLRDGSGLYKTV